VKTNVSGPTDPAPPTEDALKISAKINELNKNLILTMKEFNNILSSKILPENKSLVEKERENNLIKEMVNLAKEIDYYATGEGTLALVIFLIRQNILLRDAGNRLAYEISLFKNLSAPKDIEDANKKYIIEKAKELGIKISIEEDNEQ